MLRLNTFIHNTSVRIIRAQLLFLQQIDFLRAITDDEVIPRMSRIGDSCVSTFAVKKYKISHD